MPERDRLRPALIATAALIAAAFLPAFVGALDLDYVVGIATRILIFALAGISLNLILGYGGMVSFGHAAFFGTGAYIVGILSTHATYGEPLNHLAARGRRHGAGLDRLAPGHARRPACWR